MNFVDKTAYKRKRFEIKRNLDFNSDIKNQNEHLDLTRVHNPSVFKGFTYVNEFFII